LTEVGTTSSDAGSNRPRNLRLRYGGSCEVCQARLPVGSIAWWDPARKKVRCPSCVEDNPSSTPGASTASIGKPGGSAGREYLLRSQRHRRRTEARIADDGAWRQQVKKDHPVLGRLAAAITAKPVNDPEPNHVASWKVGADGERKVGARLDRWVRSMGGRVLHDRRIPGTKANIDHIALNANAVWVIDTKEYAGMVTASAGGLFSGPELRVAGRLRTGLADAGRRCWRRRSRRRSRPPRPDQLMPRIYCAAFCTDQAQLAASGPPDFIRHPELLRILSLRWARRLGRIGPTAGSTRTGGTLGVCS
jgi:Nuclease-related domain